MVLAFNKWSTEEIRVEDIGLQRYVNLDPRIVPRSGAKHAGNRFHKSKMFIVERLMNKMMIPGHKGKKHKKSSGHLTGKVNVVYGAIKKALVLIEQRTSQNPIAVLARAIENAAPREEIVSIEYGGARYPKAVDCAPQRRVDLVLRYISQGAYERSFNKKVSIEKALAAEIIAAFNFDSKSLAISKKNELERQCDSSR
jgi:small subunit ribosomal protein S7